MVVEMGTMDNEDNKGMIVLLQITLVSIFWLLIVHSLFYEASAWASTALVLSNLAFLLTLRKVYVQIGAAASDLAMSIYKFLLSPLTRDYKAKEANYKEIIKGLQKEIAKD